MSQEYRFLPHLLELRQRLLLVVGSIVLAFALIYPFSNALYLYLAVPLIESLPITGSLVATEIMAPFIVPLKLTFIVTIFLMIPVIFYQFWAFVSPGLYKHEKRWLLPLVIISVVLFYSGVLFAHFVVMNLVVNFFIKQTPTVIMLMPDINSYLKFMITLWVAFGIAFQTPLLTLAAIKLQLINLENIKNIRPIIIVLAFVLGMLLTPPDVISQILLALPIWGLFELGVLVSRLMRNKYE